MRPIPKIPSIFLKILLCLHFAFYITGALGRYDAPDWLQTHLYESMKYTGAGMSFNMFAPNMSSTKYGLFFDSGLQSRHYSSLVPFANVRPVTFLLGYDFGEFSPSSIHKKTLDKILSGICETDLCPSVTFKVVKYNLDLNQNPVASSEVYHYDHTCLR